MGALPDRGEFVLDDQWTGGFDDRRPLAEVAYLKARGRDAASVWDGLIDGDIEVTLAQYRGHLSGGGRFG